MNTSHLVALQQGLSNEKTRLAVARKPREIALRSVWVKQIEREVARELESLGMTAEPECTLSDDELLAALEA